MIIAEEPQSYSQSLGIYVLYFLTTLTAILTAYHYWFQSLRYVKLGNKMPGYPALPIIGNAHIAIAKTPFELMEAGVQMAKDCGKVIRLWFGNRLGVALLDPRDIELILGSSVHLEKSKEYDFFQPWLGDGLLISKGEKWRSHRKMIAPTFHQSILKTFIPIFNDNAARLVEKLKLEKGRVFDVHDHMSGSTVDVLLETAMGLKKEDERGSGVSYAKAVMDMCNILHERHCKLWLRSNIIFSLTQMATDQTKFLDIIHNLTNKVISLKKLDYFQRVRKGETSLYNEAVKETEKETTQTDGFNKMNFGTALRDDLDDNDESIGEKKRLAFLDFMIEASQIEGNKLSDLEINEEVNTIMFEGHDTTAAGSSFVLCMLGVHQDIQDKVVEELREIFKDSDRPATFNDTVNMKYLERVILETVRLYPPVPAITRVIREDLQLASGNYLVPKDTTILIGTFLVHRDPDNFENPLKFDPDNFLPEKCQKRHYYSFIPFSAGPRSCVGRKYAMLKLKVLISTIVRNFVIKSAVEEKDFRLRSDIILKRDDGFRIQLEPRIKL